MFTVSFPSFYWYKGKLLIDLIFSYSQICWVAVSETFAKQMVPSQKTAIFSLFLTGLGLQKVEVGN